MQIYRVYKSEICSIEVKKETDCYYWFVSNSAAFGYSSRIDKKDACLTPQQAIQEALNGHRTMKGAFGDKLAKIKLEILNLERLEQEYNKPLNPERVK